MGPNQKLDDRAILPKQKFQQCFLPNPNPKSGRTGPKMVKKTPNVPVLKQPQPLKAFIC